MENETRFRAGRELGTQVDLAQTVVQTPPRPQA
jgi:hypothetical protein